MDVRYFFTARYAEASTDGTLNIFGAVMSVIQAPAFPHFMTNMNLVGCVAFNREEVRSQHTIFIDFSGPDGESLFKGDDMIIHPKELPSKWDSLLININLGCENMLYTSEGIYQFKLFVDGELARSSRLLLELRPPADRLVEELSEGATL